MSRAIRLSYEGETGHFVDGRVPEAARAAVSTLNRIVEERAGA